MKTLLYVLVGLTGVLSAIIFVATLLVLQMAGETLWALVLTLLETP